MLNSKAKGLHPNSQRLLWSIFYDCPTHGMTTEAWVQLEQHGLIRHVDEKWEVTALGQGALSHYARFLKRDGLDCPPKD